MQTDGYDKANSCFLQFCECAYKRLKCVIFSYGLEIICLWSQKCYVITRSLPDSKNM